MQVWVSGNGYLMYVAKGNFIYPKEKHVLVWAPLTYPAAPSLEVLHG